MNPTAKKALIIGGGLSAVGAAVYFLFRESPNKVGQFIRDIEGDYSVAATFEGGSTTTVTKPTGNSVGKPDASTNTYNSQTGTLKCKKWLADSFPLRPCASGENVKKMQRALNKYEGAKLSIDGKYGSKTSAALARVPTNKQAEYILGTSEYFNATGDIL